MSSYKNYRAIYESAYIHKLAHSAALQKVFSEYRPPFTLNPFKSSLSIELNYQSDAFTLLYA